MTGGASNAGSAVCGGTATRRRGVGVEELEGPGIDIGALAIGFTIFGTGGTTECVCVGGRGKTPDDIKEMLS